MFTSQNARILGALGNAVKRERRSRNISPETALQTAVAVLYDATVGKNTSPLRVQAARAILATLHDAGIKPSQRDLEVVFKRVGPLAEQRTDNRADANEREAQAAQRDVTGDISQHDTSVPRIVQRVCDADVADAEGEEKSK